jgi:hypothetical protein
MSAYPVMAMRGQASSATDNGQNLRDPLMGLEVPDELQPFARELLRRVEKLESRVGGNEMAQALTNEINSRSAC